jgi:subtilisin family serine protease
VRDQIFTRTFNGFSALVSPRALAERERAHDVAGVYPVRTVYPAAPTAETIAGRDFQAGGGGGSGITLPGASGNGVTIALLDTGVDRGHAYLSGRVARGFDLVDGDRRAVPEAKPGEPGVVEAHGTRLAGLLAGHDGPTGLQGVAPGATILPIRI